MILLHKFSGNLSAGFALGQLLAQHPALQTLCFDTVIPVPLHSKRLRQRGYNQAAEIAKGLAPLYEKKGRLAANLLKRTVPTKPQIGLSHVERRKNVQGVFSTTCALKGRHILLVDDVFTTGSTLRECTDVLYKAGAEAVHVATLARARLHHNL